MNASRLLRRCYAARPRTLGDHARLIESAPGFLCLEDERIRLFRLGHAWPDPFRFWVAAGDVCLAACDFDGAWRAFARALALEPGAASAWAGLGLAQVQGFQFRPAVRAMRHALRQHPEDAAGWFTLAETYLAMVDTEGCVTYRESPSGQRLLRCVDGLCRRAVALETHADRTPPWRWLTVWAYALGRLDAWSAMLDIGRDADAVWRSASGLRGPHAARPAGVVCVLARAWLGLGRPARALVVLRRPCIDAYAFDPGTLPELYAETHMALGHWATAAGYLIQLLQTSPRHAPYHLALAACYRGAGCPARAVPHEARAEALRRQARDAR